MCFNFEASIIAFIIGEASGYLLLQSNKPIYKACGLFVMWYSLVQLSEAFIYKNYNVKLSSQMLMINLFAQGLVLVSLLHKYDLIDSKLILALMVLIFIYGLFQVNKSSFKSAELTKNCLSCKNIKWLFLNRIDKYVLLVMYSLIFYVTLTSNNDLNKIGMYFLFTLIASYLFSSKNSPSVWCYSSALVAPYLVYLSR